MINRKNGKIYGTKERINNRQTTNERHKKGQMEWQTECMTKQTNDRMTEQQIEGTNDRQKQTI